MVFMVFVGLVAYLFGGLTQGFTGGLIVFQEHRGITVLDFRPALGRYLLSLPALGLSMCSLASLAFMFSCFPMKPAAATILTLAVLFVDRILRALPMMEEYSDYFLTASISKWVQVFHESIPWIELTRAYAVLGGFSVTCFVLGWLAFSSRDLKS
jgi:ABC-2 type transport system permease protein